MLVSLSAEQYLSAVLYLLRRAPSMLAIEQRALLFTCINFLAPFEVS
jgi:hypothetical protein